MADQQSKKQQAPDDGEWDDPIEVRRPSRRQDGAQFSLRIDRPQIEALRRVADADGVTFSDAARSAIAEYVERRQRPVMVISSRRAVRRGVVVHTTARLRLT